jgi:hypothetical protein
VSSCRGGTGRHLSDRGAGAGRELGVPPWDGIPRSTALRGPVPAGSGSEVARFQKGWPERGRNGTVPTCPPGCVGRRVNSEDRQGLRGAQATAPRVPRMPRMPTFRCGWEPLTLISRRVNRKANIKAIFGTLLTLLTLWTLILLEIPRGTPAHARGSPR